MTQHPKITIITVSFNAEKYIERTILSVINQTYENIEYLIIDGASKDGTMTVVQKYADKIDYCISEPDKSHFDAMNKGLRRATGDYILYMNAGDQICKSTSLEEMLNGSKGEDFLYSRAEYIDEAGNRRPWHKRTPSPDRIAAKSFINGMVVCHHCIVVKREITPEFELGPWKVSNDLDWAIRIMKKVKSVHFYDDIFCLYLEGGISAKQRKKAVDERFDITVKHFGLWPTLFEQFKIGFQLVKRKKFS